jgi:hypothetical protein
MEGSLVVKTDWKCCKLDEDMIVTKPMRLLLLFGFVKIAILFLRYIQFGKHFCYLI